MSDSQLGAAGTGAGLGALTGLGVGALHGALSPGQDEEGRRKSRLQSALMTALGYGAVGAGVGGAAGMMGLGGKAPAPATQLPPGVGAVIDNVAAAADAVPPAGIQKTPLSLSGAWGIDPQTGRYVRRQ